MKIILQSQCMQFYLSKVDLYLNKKPDSKHIVMFLAPVVQGEFYQKLYF